MPRNTERPLNADEQRFIRHYVRERDIEKAEKKARLKQGQGIKFWKKPEIKSDIERRIRDIEHEQAVLDAKDIDRKEATLAELLDPELCKVIRLEAEKYGAIKLKAMELGYVVAGRIRQRNTESLDRNPGSIVQTNFYQSVFDRVPAQVAVAAQEATAAQPQVAAQPIQQSPTQQSPTQPAQPQNPAQVPAVTSQPPTNVSAPRPVRSTIRVY